MQAPVISTPRAAELAFGVGNFSDILAVRGFSHPRLLGPAIDAWSDLFDLTRPNLLIADFSPTAIAAAHSRIPTVKVGYGFYVPPDHLAQFPSFRDDVPPVLPERTVLATVQQVLTERGRVAPKTLPALFQAEYSHVYSLPPLDPYGIYRVEPGSGPIQQVPDPTPLPNEQRVFAYLAPDYPRITDVIKGLGELGSAVEVYFQGAERTLSVFAQRRGLQVHQKRPSPPDLFPRVSVVISHGGSGVVHAAMLAARPQFLMPRHAEGHGTAIMLETIGGGRRLTAELGSRAVKEIIRGGMDDPRFSAAVRDATNVVRAHYRPTTSLEALVDACNDLAFASRTKAIAT